MGGGCVKYLILVLVALIAGCASSHPRTIVWSKNLEFGVKKWRQEAEERFGPKVFLLVCHGDNYAGLWVFTPDPPHRIVSVQSGVEIIRSFEPTAPIVLVTCNPSGWDLHGLKGVYYCHRNVLMPPYSRDPELRKRWADRAAGSIWEFSDHE
jgi:hypothetical protein